MPVLNQVKVINQQSIVLEAVAVSHKRVHVLLVDLVNQHAVLVAHEKVVPEVFRINQYLKVDQGNFLLSLKCL